MVAFLVSGIRDTWRTLPNRYGPGAAVLFCRHMLALFAKACDFHAVETLKMDILCEHCGKYVESVNEADMCEDCHDKWFQEQYAYWRPLYEGEVLAGLVGEKEPK